MPPKAAEKKKGSPKDSKSSSPKTKKEKTSSPKNKKKSPTKKKKSPPSDGLPVSIGVQTEHSTLCMLCKFSFRNAISIQSHLAVMDHAAYDETGLMKCRCCSLKFKVLQTEKHACVRYKTNYMDQVLGSSTIKVGPPTVCLLCKGRKFHSKGELISHLICAHSPRKLPNICGLCNFNYEEPIIPEEEDELPEYNKDWDEHVIQIHSLPISLIAKRNISLNSELRYPYSCPLCGFSMTSNAEFHAHIICRHTSTYFYETELFVCVQCDKPYTTNDALNDHIQHNHVKSFIILGRKLIREGRIYNQLNYSHTCTICWSTFEYDFYLQAHLLVSHTKLGTYICGICSKDFSVCGTLKNVSKHFVRHEQLHMNEFHKTAIEFRITTDDVVEIPPDSDEEPPVEETDNKKKGSPKQKKGSPKQKNNKSPDKAKKEKNSPSKKFKKENKVSPKKI